MVATVSLADRADQLTGNLSAGQRARASLATALLGDPALLVLDEPTVGRDLVLRRDLWSHFRRLASAGVTLLVSSHVMDEAEHCDRLLLMRDGALVTSESPDKLRSRTGKQPLEDAFLALIVPQLLLCGLCVARDQMAQALTAVSDALPLSYAFDALQRATVRGTLGGRGVFFGCSRVAM